MKVTICMNSGECEVMDFEDTICIAGEDVELGYLKINPERIPAIVAANIAEEEIKRMAEHRMHLDVCGNYMVITDDRAVVCTEDEVAVYGTAYIVRKQAGTYTALTYGELDDWIYDFEDTELFSELFPEEYPQDNAIHIPKK